MFQKEPLPATSAILSSAAMISGFGPPPPPRTSSSKDPKNEESGWREAIGVLLAVLLSISVLFSVITLLYYCYRDKAVYEELVDYLDKTVSISKINFNPSLGFYELRPKELEDLGRHRRVSFLLRVHGTRLVNTELVNNHQ